MTQIHLNRPIDLDSNNALQISRKIFEFFGKNDFKIEISDINNNPILFRTNQKLKDVKISNEVANRATQIDIITQEGETFSARYQPAVTQPCFIFKDDRIEIRNHLNSRITIFTLETEK